MGLISSICEKGTWQWPHKRKRKLHQQQGHKLIVFHTLHLVRPKPPTLPSISVSDKMTHDTGISIVVSNVAGSFPPPDSVTPSNTLLQYRFDGASAWTTAEEL